MTKEKEDNRIFAKKSLGQHFLINPKILDKIVSAGEVNKDDIILEIGPGRGNLTEKLAEKAKTVIAIEKDKELFKKLKENFKENKNILLFEGDILKFDLKKLNLAENNYKIIANIPYYITSRLLKFIFEKFPKPKLIVLTIQKEVAKRITAKPPKMNLLAISVQYFSEVKVISYVSKKNFLPKPKVDSAIVKIKPKNLAEEQNFRKKFFRILKAGFSQKRKFLIGNLIKKLKIKRIILIKIFKKQGFDLKIRAEGLSLDDWLKLTNEIKLNQ